MSYAEKNFKIVQVREIKKNGHFLFSKMFQQIWLCDCCLKFHIIFCHKHETTYVHYRIGRNCVQFPRLSIFFIYDDTCTKPKKKKILRNTAASIIFSLTQER